ncbi:dethiobiotin synthase [Alkalimonas amylolytica]|uniref:ATP-dependent dethiobiotin synthetase BioD n=1 Tax=Alkalimonas amylolytica TaxID=152573 RepID=A0A1H3ZA18_ALKAM|nr:dethiobiotin synthase [Alkalimonas amylolytica]SEA20214.1 dethiobiotin synthetase [Alkalimonas amylolytica]
MHSFFVTGTDTDAGKTYVSRALLQGLAQAGYRAIGAKPIAAGVDSSGKNPDALALQTASSVLLDYAAINPILLQAAVAPHLAAVIEQQPLDETVLSQQLTELKQQAELVLVEGAGGWLLPLSDSRYLADWVAEQQLPVLLVVGMKLGCLNHAMLTVREIERSGLCLLGWVANCIDPAMQLQQENIADLQQRIPAPCLGVLPYQPAGTSQTQQQALARALLAQLKPD